MKYFWLSVFFLAGCAETIWHRPGVTERDFLVDRYECDRDTRMASGSFVEPRQQDTQTGYRIYGNTVAPYQQPNPWAGLSNLGATLQEGQNRQTFFKRCMEVRG